MRSVAAIAMIALVLVLFGGSALLNRIDRLHAAQRATDARVRLAEARLALARVELTPARPAPQNASQTALVETCVRRTDALRAALFALVRTGNASMTGDPSWEFIAWR